MVDSLLNKCSKSLESGRLRDYLYVSNKWRRIKDALASPDIKMIEATYHHSLGEPLQDAELLLLKSALVTEQTRFNKARSCLFWAAALLEDQLHTWRSSGAGDVVEILKEVYTKSYHHDWS